MSDQPAVLLAALSISFWQARKFDGNATSEVEANHVNDLSSIAGDDSSERIGRFNKRLLPSIGAYKEIRSLAGRLRTWWYQQTLEYEDDVRGTRLLTAANFMDVASHIRHQRSLLEELTERFLYTEYAEMQDIMRRVLNGLYKESDYPSAEALIPKFGIKVSFRPFPNAQSYGLDLPQHVLDDLIAQTQADNAEVLQRSMREVWERLYKVVNTITNQMASPTGNLHVATANRARELCELLPKLNFAEDPHLENMRSQLVEKVLIHAPADLRQDDGLKSSVGVEAARIQAMMSSFMGPTSFDAADEDDLFSI